MLAFRDSGRFVAGERHRHLKSWSRVASLDFRFGFGVFRFLGFLFSFRGIFGGVINICEIAC